MGASIIKNARVLFISLSAVVVAGYVLLLILNLKKRNKLKDKLEKEILYLMNLGDNNMV